MAKRKLCTEKATVLWWQRGDTLLNNPILLRVVGVEYVGGLLFLDMVRKNIK